MSLSEQLKDRIVIVTGAAQGLGTAIVRILIERGAKVVSTDAKAQHDSSAAWQMKLDVTSESEWISVCRSVFENFGRIDGLVNNAGVSDYSYLTDTSLDEWNRVIAVNETGPFLGMKTTIPYMIKQESGSIVNVSSICGSTAVEASPAYHASKHALLSMTRNVAVTYARQGIRANAIQPGWFPTPLTLAQSEESNSGFLSRTPMARPGDPDDIGRVAAFLISHDAAYITGASIPVDGGYLAQ